MSEKTMVNDLTTGSVSRKLIAFAIPMVLASLLQVVYNIVDMIIIGHFIGSTALAAVGNSGELMFLCQSFALGFGGASQTIISQYVGAGDRRGMSRTVGTTLSFMALLAVGLTVVTMIFSRGLLTAINIPDAAYAQALAYSRTCYCGLIFIFGYNMVSSILRGMGDSKRPMIFIGIASGVNLVLDLVFVVGFHMDTFGAALATVIAQALSFIIAVIYLFRRRESFGFDFKAGSFAIDKSILSKLLRLGLPMSLQNFGVCITMLIINAFINAYGVAEAAVTQIGTKYRQMAVMIGFAVGGASGAMIGQCMGAKKLDRVRQTVHSALAICMSSGAVIAVITLLFPVPLFKIFSSDPEVLAWAPKFMVTMAITVLSFSLVSACNGFINGIGHAKMALVVSLIDGIVARLGLALLMGLAFRMGVMGFWYGNALAPFSTCIIVGIYYLSGRWRTRKIIIED